MKNNLDELTDMLSNVSHKITKKFGKGEALDGDETFSIATLFNIVLDLNNGNITEKEYELEVERLIDDGNIPLFTRKKGK